VAIDFGIISPNSSNKNVTRPVAIQIAADSENGSQPEVASEIAKLVAKAAVKVLTKLFQIKIVISSLSLFVLIFLRAFDQYFFCFNKLSNLWSAKLIRANSVPEKNAERKNKTINRTISKGSKILN